MLRTDVVEFQYEKKNGDLRHTYGTRNPKIIADKIGASPSSNIKGKSYDRPGFVNYFDMEKGEERSLVAYFAQRPEESDILFGDFTTEWE